MASVLIRTMTEGDHGFYAPAWNKNGTLRPGFAKGKHEPFAEFAYYIRWTEGGKRHVQCVGKDPAVAIMAMCQKDGVPGTTAPEFAAPAQPGNGRRSIASVTAAWLLWAKEHKSPGIYDAYKRTSEAFHGFLAERGGTPVFLDQITEGLILDYKIWLERKGYAEAYRWKLLNQLHRCLCRAKHFNWISKDDMLRRTSVAATWSIRLSRRRPCWRRAAPSRATGRSAH
jgi:hypothetical protein